MAERVDYERAAGTYDRGRALGDHALDAWGDVVRARLPDPEGRPVVLDLGSGTGLFSQAWLRWGAGVVLAVEPSTEMRARALTRLESGVSVLAGRAAPLPLRDACADVAWLSAVVHHLPRLDDAARELRRVLRPDGRVFVRGYFPGASTLPWLRHFPGSERANARFPTAAALAAAWSDEGFESVDAANVADPDRHTRAEAAEWVQTMRNADSILGALTDDEIAAGIAALRERPDELLEPLALTLLTFRT